MLGRAARTLWSALADGVVGAVLLGVLAPLAGLTLHSVLGASAYGLWFPPYPAAFLVAGLASVALYALSFAPWSRSQSLAPWLGGACACGALLAGAVALVVSFLLLGFLAVGIPGWIGEPELPAGLLGLLAACLIWLLPSAPCVLFARRMDQLLRPTAASTFVPRRDLALLAGFLVPLALGTAVELGLGHVERDVIARYVDAEQPEDTRSLQRLRPLRFLHPWPELHERAVVDDYVDEPNERERRARAAFEALTGVDLERRFAAD